MISILFDNAYSSKDFDNSMIDRAVLDEVFTSFCPDILKRNYFIDIVSRPLTNEGEIIKRQQLIDLFIRYPSFYEDFSVLLKNLSVLSNEYEKIRKDSKTLGVQNNVITQATAKISALQIGSLSAKKLLTLLVRMQQIIAPYASEHVWLAELNKRLYDLTIPIASQAFRDLLDSFENFYPSEQHLKYQLTLSGSHIKSINLIFDGIEVSKRRRISDSSLRDEFSSTLVYHAIDTLLWRVYEFIDILFDEFLPLCDEILFYETALRYTDFLEKMKKPSVFPTFGVDTVISELYDILLLFRKSGDVVPNDFAFPNQCNGTLIYGKNGSGKTVYLRSILLAFLLSQAGLPIPATSAKISICCGVAFLFSAYDDNRISNDIGRFEFEVEKMARIVKNTPKNGIVFLNEIFQSTAYSEGADALYEILSYLTNYGVKWILVSHLKSLETKFESKAVTLLSFDNEHSKYKLNIKNFPNSF